jgi:hypothetical protein
MFMQYLGGLEPSNNSSHNNFGNQFLGKGLNANKKSRKNSQSLQINTPKSNGSGDKSKDKFLEYKDKVLDMNILNSPTMS